MVNILMFQNTLTVKFMVRIDVVEFTNRKLSGLPICEAAVHNKCSTSMINKKL